MINQEVIVNQQLQERIHYDNPDFPLARFIDEMDYFVDGEFLCHWHPEFELAIILKGGIEYQVDQQVFRLHQGEGIFITSQALHSARQLIPGSIIFNIEFPASLFHTIGTSFLYQNYFNPSSLKKMGSWKILPENEEGSEILERLMHIHRSDPDKYAYELLCMEDILHIWRNLLVLLHRSFLVPTDNDEFIREHRMRKMVSYIQSHFEQPLTIDDIAGAASISRSECFRCFSGFCQVSPIEYLNRYRLQNAAQKLSGSTASISDISFQCGFSSISYFGKAFRKMYGLSPSEYRQKKKNAVSTSLNA